MVGDVGLEGDALDVIHDEVRGVVFVEVAGHTGDVGVADELRQSFGLVEKTLFPIEEVLLPAGRYRQKQSDRPCGRP